MRGIALLKRSCSGIIVGNLLQLAHGLRLKLTAIRVAVTF